MNLYTLGGRRFLLTIGAGLVTAFLQWFGKLDPSGGAFSVVIVATVGAFIAGNVVEGKKEKPNVELKKP